jgi:GTP cyclohydrolase FolE2
METEWTRMDNLMNRLKKTGFKNVLIVTRGRGHDVNKNIMDVSIFRRPVCECPQCLKSYEKVPIQVSELWMIASSIEELGWGDIAHNQRGFESKIIEQKDLVLYTHLKYKDPLFFKLLEE